MNNKRSIDEDDDRSFKKSNKTDKKDRIKTTLFPIDAYTKHKMLMNQYVLNKPGNSFARFDDVQTDLDILEQNHKFLWDSDEDEQSNEINLTWGERLAKKYYDRLYKEYCICDLSKYEENKIAMRWRTEKEVVLGKGQFICGNKICEEKDNLKSWEVNFEYKEAKEEKKNALVKLRLCPECSDKLNYHHKKKEVTINQAVESTSEKAEEEEDNLISQKVDNFLDSLLV